MRDAPCRALTPKSLPPLKRPPPPPPGGRPISRGRDTKCRVLTLRIRLLAQHQVDERIRHVVQLAHALRVELGGGVVGQPDGVDRRIDERLRGHYLVELPVQVLADRPHAAGQARLLAQHRPQEHVRHREHAYEGHQDRRRGLHRRGFAPIPTHRERLAPGTRRYRLARLSALVRVASRRGDRNAERRNRTAVPPPCPPPGRSVARARSRASLSLSLLCARSLSRALFRFYLPS